MTQSDPHVAFKQHALPPLKSGNFVVTVTQAVSVLGQGDTFTTNQPFFVAGERYGLGAGDIDSVFPPAGNQGEFSNNLAHVVLTSPTLPWQRSPNVDDPEPVAGQPVPTWMAVLLFDQDDPPPKPQHVTIADLVTSGTRFFAPREPEDQEQSTDPVTVIDIPIALFNATAPSLADLDWTAHVREVDPAAKAAGGPAPPPVDYSVVFGNRLPVAGNTATAHLVSLEGYGPYLPGEDGSGAAGLAGFELVRVVTLSSWTFTALDLQQSFAGLLTQLNKLHTDPGSLQLPYYASAATGNAAAEAAVKDAFGMGYTAMDHTLRDGSSTVSFYRGPLLPLATPATAAPAWSDADQLVRYDPDTGMLDVSYAAAWQLGRLLALHDAAFAAALYRWKLTQTQAQVTALEQQVIDEELAVVAQPSAPPLPGPPASGARHARLAAVIRDVVGPAAERLASQKAEG